MHHIGRHLWRLVRPQHGRLVLTTPFLLLSTSRLILLEIIDLFVLRQQA
jgi:hypothetical protein